MLKNRSFTLSTTPQRAVWYIPGSVTEGDLTEPETEDTDLSAGFFIADSDLSTIKDCTNTGSHEDGRPVDSSTGLLESFEVRGAGKAVKFLAPTENFSATDLQITLSSRKGD